MKKGIVIAVGIVIIGVGAILALTLPKKEVAPLPEVGMPPATVAPEIIAQEAVEPQEQGFFGKFKDALALGQSLKCTSEITVEGTTVEVLSTTYVKGKKAHGEANTPAGKTNFIVSDNCYYSWGEGAPIGIKICELEEEGEGEAEIPEEVNVDVDCRPAVVSDSLFNLPSGVEFQEFGTFTPEGFEGLEF